MKYDFFLYKESIKHKNTEIVALNKNNESVYDFKGKNDVL